jgi:hypothetical protein
VFVDGTLSTNGQDTTTGTYNCGGGAGGSILLFTNKLRGHGIISSNGGSARDYINNGKIM